MWVPHAYSMPATAGILMHVFVLTHWIVVLLLLAAPAGVFDSLQQQGRVASLIRGMLTPAGKLFRFP
jgi:hypothetical protein